MWCVQKYNNSSRARRLIVFFDIEHKYMFINILTTTIIVFGLKLFLYQKTPSKEGVSVVCPKIQYKTRGYSILIVFL